MTFVVYFNLMDAMELKFANAFNAIPNIGGGSLRTLKKHFGNLANAWQASASDLQAVGLNQPALAGIAWKKPSLNPDREIEKLFKENIWLLNEEDKKFPAVLKEIPSPPFLIYGRGRMELLTEKGMSVGVVGTRKPTSYGIEVVQKIVSGLVRAGLTIISGLATGIDSQAHETTLAEKGKTVAVLGCGVDQSSIFPPENRGLARKIIESGGIVLSEYSPGTPGVKEHFPQRNRIISGLSRGVLVVEARERSGALITSRLALDQNREVFAVPGSIFSLASFGPNQLISQGAKLVTSAKDILDELGLDYTELEGLNSSEPIDEKEWTVLQLLEEPLGVDALVEKTGLNTSVLLSSLSMLELKGKIKNMGGDTYQKI
ncbi:MAG: DNA-processing protein DprA [bacterium]|nr:DNA-processing protein DprA [bacterium]